MMRISIFTLLFHILALNTTPLHANIEEAEALLQWKINGLSSTSLLDSWSVNNLTNLCSWEGIICNLGGSVSELNLPHENIRGTLEPLPFSLLPNLTRINLNNNSLSGVIPSAITSLLKLTFLDLGNNNFTGPIPVEVGQLTYLDLSKNHFTGQIPVSVFSKLQKLEEHLDLGNNFFQGPFPISLTNSSNLKFLDLSHNKLSGTIPDEIGSITSLRVLQLFNNSFHGKFPSPIGNLTQLWLLNLGMNQLSSAIPPSIGDLQNLRSLFLDENHLSGPIPAAIGNFTQLLDLNLSHNNLSESIPWEIGYLTSLSSLSINRNLLHGPQTLLVICNLTSLTLLSLAHNKLNGHIPKCLGNTRSLSILSLHRNQFHGDIPESLCNASQLHYLSLSNNYLNGVIPKCMGNFSNELSLLDLEQNNLNGPMHREFCSSSTPFTVLDLSDNSLSGVIPPCLGNLSTTLSILDLSMNHFHGTIPAQVSKDNVLKALILDHNHIEGPLPRTLINCTTLHELDVGNNKLNDSFPHWLDALALPQLIVLVLRSNHFHGVIGNPTTKLPFPMLQVFDISNNCFTGPLPRYYLLNFTAMINNTSSDLHLIYSKRNLSFQAQLSASLVVKGFEVSVVKILNLYTLIDLASNMFSGEIPTSIGNLFTLRFLNLSQNRLTGHIPSSLGSLTLLEELDLSCNQLIGKIPWQLSKLGFLEVLNLSYNHLYGKILRSGQLDTFDNDSYMGNTALCGFPMTVGCEAKKPPVHSKEEEEDSGFFNGFSWQSVTIGYCCAFPLGVCVGYFALQYGKLNWLLRKLTWKRGKGSKNTVPRRRARTTKFAELPRLKEKRAHKYT